MTENQNNTVRRREIKKQTKEDWKYVEITYSIRNEGKQFGGVIWVKIGPKSPLFDRQGEERGDGLNYCSPTINKWI